MQKENYINDDITKGIQIDYAKVNKLYKSLNCPKNTYNPTKIPFNRARWEVIMSIRSRGKTTNVILYLLCIKKLYGFSFAYLRDTLDAIMPKNTKNLFKVIEEFHYIEKLFDGKWNSIKYNSRSYILCKRDKDGTVIEEDTEPFCYMLCLDLWNEYKSTFNNPRCYNIVFDEFIGKFYREDSFIHLCDIMSTVFRGKWSCNTILLANNLNRHSQYFNELAIYDYVKTIEYGKSSIVTSPLGTNVYVEMIANDEETQKETNALMRLYFGFLNPKLSAITGAQTWAITNYPHIPIYRKEEDGKAEEIIGNRYILFNNQYIRLRIMKDDTIGLMVWCSKSTINELYEDSIVYTHGNIYDKRYRYKFGFSKIDKLIFTLFNRNKFYYATNDIGNMVENYISEKK